MVAPLLPTRMDPTVLTTAHVSCCLAGPFLVVIVSLGVVRVAPGRAGRCQKLIQSWRRRRLLVSHIKPLIIVRGSHSRGSSCWLLLAWLPPSRRRLVVTRGIHGPVTLALVRSPVRVGAVVVVMVGVAVFV